MCICIDWVSELADNTLEAGFLANWCLNAQENTVCVCLKKNKVIQTPFVLNDCNLPCYS